MSEKTKKTLMKQINVGYVRKKIEEFEDPICQIKKMLTKMVRQTNLDGSTCMKNTNESR